MSVQSEITRLASAKNAIATAIANKGVTVPNGTKLDGMSALISSIESGGGGSSVSVNTGTVLANISDDGKSGTIFSILYTSFYNGEITANEVVPDQNGSAEASNVLDNSLLCLAIENYSNYYTHTFDTIGVTVTIELYTSDGSLSFIILEKKAGNASIYVK